jgi:alpha-glucosidase
MLVGEIYTPPPGNNLTVLNYLDQGDNALHLAFDFSLIFRYWNARKYFKCIESWELNLPEKGWPTYVLSNHDLLRSYNRFGIGRNKHKKAYLTSLLLLTLRGTPFIYYGEEIGMQNQKIRRKYIKDPLGIKFWPFFTGRDKSRTPMQWSENKYAGFSNVKPWLPVNRNFFRVNIEQQSKSRCSLLSHYKSLISFRNENKTLQQGKIVFVNTGQNGILGYYRIFENQTLYILLNFKNSILTLPLNREEAWECIYSINDRKDKLIQDFIVLEKYEGLILKLLS